MMPHRRVITMVCRQLAEDGPTTLDPWFVHAAPAGHVAYVDRAEHARESLRERGVLGYGRVHFTLFNLGAAPQTPRGSSKSRRGVERHLDPTDRESGILIGDEGSKQRVG
jgi:hypothetical protein